MPKKGASTGIFFGHRNSIGIFVCAAVALLHLTIMHPIQVKTTIILLAAILPACACLQKSDNDFEAKLAADVPSQIKEWNATGFVFRDGECVCLQSVSSLSKLRTLDAREGDRISVVAYSSPDSAGFTALRSGRASQEYRLTSQSEGPEIGRVWYFEGEASNGYVQMPFKPLHAEFSFEVLGDGSAASLDIEGLASEWIVESDSLAPSPVLNLKLESGKSYRVLPPVSEKIDLAASFSYGGENFSPVLEGVTAPRSGQIAQISLDLRSADVLGVYSLTYTLKEGNAQIASWNKDFSLGTEVNSHYAVSIYRNGAWQGVKVHDALCSNARKHTGLWNDWSNSRALRDTMSYCIFEHEFTSAVRVRVKKLNGSFSSCVVRPSTYLINATSIDYNTVEFSLPSPSQAKVSVEFDGDRFRNLFIYGYKPDADKPDPNSVIYYGPGEHDAGTINLRAGQTLYIDYGAKVYGNVVTEGNDVTIAGHGILSGEKMQHYGDHSYSYGDFLMACNKTSASAKNLTVRDVTLIDGPGWNLLVRNIEGVLIDGVNTISWELNGDGIDVVSSRDVEIKNCFLRNYDDNITLKCRFIVSPITDVCNVRIHDNLIWNDYARGIVVGPEAGNLSNPGYLHDIKVYDCIFLEHGDGQSVDLRAAFAIGQGNDGLGDLWSGNKPPRTISGVEAWGLVFDNLCSYGRAVGIRQYADSSVTMSDISLSDFTVIDENGNKYPALSIWTGGASITGLVIENFTVNGVKLLSTGEEFTIDKSENVKYEIK